MKAKVIKTGEVIEVHRNISGWASDDQLNKTRLFDESELDFDYQNWELFRRRAAKDILANMAGQLVHDSTTIAIDEFNPEFYAKVAVEWADALIAKLKEK